MVGGHDDHRCVRIVAAYQHGCQSDAGGGITLTRFTDDRGGRQLGHVYLDRFDQTLICDHERLFVGDQLRKPLDCLMQHGMLAHQREQLLGLLCSAGWPESGAGATGHNDRVKHVGRGQG